MFFQDYRIGNLFITIAINIIPIQIYQELKLKDGSTFKYGFKLSSFSEEILPEGYSLKEGVVSRINSYLEESTLTGLNANTFSILYDFLNKSKGEISFISKSPCPVCSGTVFCYCTNPYTNRQLLLSELEDTSYSTDTNVLKGPTGPPVTLLSKILERIKKYASTRKKTSS